jgi:mRNA-degrading endonuclease RelE of RelBE toxin-antitoxin system
MSYNVETIAAFDKQLKCLAKKYPSLKSEYADLVSELEKHPEQGTPIGQSCYKIRIAITSKGKGKSGGARIIYYVQVSDTLVVLLSIYDKSEQDSINDNDLEKLLRKIDL